MQIVQAGAAAAVAAPLLRPNEAQAVPLGSRFSYPYDKTPKTPVRMCHMSLALLSSSP